MHINTKIKKSTLSDLLFFLALGLYLAMNIIDSSMICTMYNNPKRILEIVMKLTIFIILLRECLVKKINLREVLYLLICSVLSFLLYYHLNQLSMLPLFFLLYSGRNINLEKILKFINIVLIILVPTIIIFAKLNIIPNYIFYHPLRTREYLGFRYSLYPQMYWFNISAISFYLHRNKMSYSILIILTVINYTVFKLTGSRLSFYLFILLAFAYVISHYKWFINLIKKMKIIRTMLVLSYIICAIVSFIVTIKYNSSSSFYNELNTKFENRLKLGKTAIDVYGIKMFGNDIELYGNGIGRSGRVSSETQSYNYVDCLYINAALKYGILFIILFLMIYTISLNNINKKEEYLLLIILSVLALHGIIDDLGMQLYYNGFWFAISANFFPKRNINID